MLKATLGTDAIIGTTVRFISKSFSLSIDGQYISGGLASITYLYHVVSQGTVSTPGSGYVLLHHVMGETDGDRGIWS